MIHSEGMNVGLIVGLSVGHRVDLREGPSVSLIVGIVVDQIVRLILGLSIIMSGGLDAFLNVGPGLGLIFIQIMGRNMVRIGVFVCVRVAGHQPVRYV